MLLGRFSIRYDGFTYGLPLGLINSIIFGHVCSAICVMHRRNFLTLQFIGIATYAKEAMVKRLACAAAAKGHRHYAPTERNRLFMLKYKYQQHSKACL